MNEITLTIVGAPTGKGRPRFDPRTRRTYTDAKTTTAEARVMVAWEQAGRPRLPDGPVALMITQSVSRPKSHWRRDGTLSAEGRRRPWPDGRKPDFDNAAKLIADALNGCAYRDDADVVHHWFVRQWAHRDEPEHTEVVIRPMATGLDPRGIAA